MGWLRRWQSVSLLLPILMFISIVLLLNSMLDYQYSLSTINVQTHFQIHTKVHQELQDHILLEHPLIVLQNQSIELEIQAQQSLAEEDQDQVALDVVAQEQLLLDVVGKEGRALHLMNMIMPPSIIYTISAHIESLLKSLHKAPKLVSMFRRTFSNTLETTCQIVLPNQIPSLALELPSVHVITGDIEALWLRDSAAQVMHYIRFARTHRDLQAIIEGVIRQHVLFINMDIMANAFRRTLWDRPLNSYEISEGKGGHIAERKYELDSLAYFIRLSYEFWKGTGIKTHLDSHWESTVWSIVCLWYQSQVDAPGVFATERRWINQFMNYTLNYCSQVEGKIRDYRHPELSQFKGSSVSSKKTGLLWSGFRPSDDKCTYHYLIPSNMFAVVELHHIAEIAIQVLNNQALASFALELAESVDDGIHQYGVINHEQYGSIYAYEVDGLGNYELMDDANIPSLLSIDYLKYSSEKYDSSNSIANNTRRFIQSTANRFFYQGSALSGIGSPHTRPRFVWPMSIIMNGLTSRNLEERWQAIETISITDADTYMVHESVNADDPRQYTRPWFAWANSLFAELIITTLELQQLPIEQVEEL